VRLVWRRPEPAAIRFDDRVADRQPHPQAAVSQGLVFLREHDDAVETNGALQGLQMLAAGRVDYAFANLPGGMRDITAMGLSGKIEPLLSAGVTEGGQYVCFTKERVSPSFVEAFSRALKQFKQTDAFQAIYHKYFP
jgi:polar amino acid transport system substrate-binding protein